MSSNDLQILTGWSRATLYHQKKREEKPTTNRSLRRKRYWDVLAILEWLSRFNLETIMTREDFLEYERTLLSLEQIDPVLRTTLGRVIERENLRRAQTGDAAYAAMRLVTI